jgi:hypothetical protein
VTEVHLLALLVLDLDEPLLLDLLFLAQVDGLLDLLSFVVSLLAHVVDLVLLVLLEHLLHAHLVHFLLDFVLVFLLQGDHLGGALFGFLDFLPGAHLLLLEERDAVRQQLRVTLNTNQHLA